MSLLRDAAFLSAALGHLAVDLLNAQRPVLLAVLSGPLGLTNAAIGVISALYTFSGSLAQPLFGWVADRKGLRWLAAGGLLWMGVFFGLAVIAPGPLSIVLLILAALGSAAFHPAGTVEAADVGRLRFRGGGATAASLFFLFGQTGYSIGPAIGGHIVDRWGPAGLLLLLPLVLPAGVFVAARFPGEVAPAPVPNPGDGSAATRPRWVTLLPLILLSALRSWAQTNMITFLPKYYFDLGYSASAFGVIAALFMGGSALGGVAGAWLADRYSRRAVTVWSLLAGAGVLAVFPGLSQTAWALPLSVAAGALTGASHSILIVEAQRLMPNSLGTASGLALGFFFAAGSAGTALSGLHADLAGLEAVFHSSALITLAAGALALRLPPDPARPTTPG